MITQESGKTLDWLHNRCPAILETNQQVIDWLDYERIPADKCLKLVRKPRNLMWHRVENYVNDSKNKDERCVEPLKVKFKDEDEKMSGRKRKSSETEFNLRKRRKN